MAKIKLNFEKASDNPSSFSIIPEGVHKAILKNAEVKATANDPDKKYIAWTFRFPDHEDRELVLRNMINQKDNNTWIKATLVALGQDVSKGLFEFETNNLVGKVVSAKVRHTKNMGRGEHEGKEFTNDEIAQVYRPDGQPASSGGSTSDGLDFTQSSGGSSPAPGEDIPF